MREKSHIPFSLVRILNVMGVTAPFALVWFSYYQPRTMTAGLWQSSALLIAIYVVAFYRICSRMDGFRVSIVRISELIFGQVIAIGVTNICAVFGIWVLSNHFPKILPVAVCFVMQCLIIAPVAMASHMYFFKHHKPYETVVIFDSRQGVEKLIRAYGLEKRFHVQGLYAIEDVITMPECIHDAEAVFICGVHSRDRNTLLKRYIRNGQKVYLIPGVGDMLMSGAEQMHMLHLPMLRVKRSTPSIEYHIIKRIIDIAASAITMFALSPVFLAVALVIRRDGGPALYRQTRLTKDGKTFEILKFRSMCVDAEKFSGAVLSTGENDPRITKVGRFIRACRIDELPQLWNIFVGDMSIVGPRPERPEIAAQYEKELPEFQLRLQVKAGLTGYAQVYGKYNTTPYDKLLMDLMYISKPSLYEDFAIILATMRILFMKESTEGVAAGQVTAIEPKMEKSA